MESARWADVGACGSAPRPSRGGPGPTGSRTGPRTGKTQQEAAPAPEAPSAPPGGSEPSPPSTNDVKPTQRLHPPVDTPTSLQPLLTSRQALPPHCPCPATAQLQSWSPKNTPGPQPSRSRCRSRGWSGTAFTSTHRPQGLTLSQVSPDSAGPDPSSAEKAPLPQEQRTA